MFKKFFYLVVILLSPLVVAGNSFVIKDIRVEGLERISADSIFATIPVGVNERVNAKNIRDTIAALFRSGDFDDVEIGREANTLVIRLHERPSVSKIEIKGNKAIKTEDLMKGLDRSGLAEGKLFKRATLEGIRLELQRQYVAQGRYDSQISTTIKNTGKNTVSILINVDEGTVAKVKHFNIVGNKHFSTQTLVDELQMRQTEWLSFIKGNDKYSKEGLQGDLERLEAFYRNRGYLKFMIDSTQVALSPEKNAVFITINVTEGDIYSVSDIKLSGDIVLPESVIRSLILLKPGKTFSQALVTQTQELISKVLGNDGYTFAKVRSYPKIDEKNKTVALTLFVDPGKRTYVNRIIFKGNTTTRDEVLRRELRQMEAAPASGSKIEQSRLYLNRLGFFKDVKSDIVKVPGKDDLVDVVFNVEEQPSGSVNASIGYSDGSGLLLSAGLQQNNFLGSGNSVGFSVSKNDYQKSVDFSFNNPYYTIDGVSRGFNVYYRNTDFRKAGISSYSTDTYGAGLNYSYPISEGTSLGFGIGYANIRVHTGPYAPQEIVGTPARPSNFRDLDYIYRDGAYPESLDSYDAFYKKYGYYPSFAKPGKGFLDIHGDTYNNYKINLSWQQFRLNRGMLPTDGYEQRVGLELGVPGSDLEYYKMTYSGQIYFPITDEYILRLHARLGAGFGYGGTSRLPFLENFFSGGIGSIRGYERSTLGPRGTDAENYTTDFAYERKDGKLVPIIDPVTGLPKQGLVFDPVSKKLETKTVSNKYNNIGGNVLVESGAELIFPLWFIKDRSSLRTALFLDAGNVFDTQCNSTQADCSSPDITKLNASIGVGLTWYSPMGPLSFSIAEPFNYNEVNKGNRKYFQFTIGTGF